MPFSGNIYIDTSGDKIDTSAPQYMLNWLSESTDGTLGQTVTRGTNEEFIVSNASTLITDTLTKGLDASFGTVDISGTLNVKGTSIPVAQVKSDWDVTDTNSSAYIEHKPTNLVTTAGSDTLYNKTLRNTTYFGTDSNTSVKTKFVQTIRDGACSYLQIGKDSPSGNGHMLEFNYWDIINLYSSIQQDSSIRGINLYAGQITMQNHSGGASTNVTINGTLNISSISNPAGTITMIAGNGVPLTQNICTYTFYKSGKIQRSMDPVTAGSPPVVDNPYVKWQSSGSTSGFRGSDKEVFRYDGTTEAEVIASDDRLKSRTEPINNAINTIMQLNPVKYLKHPCFLVEEGIEDADLNGVNCLEETGFIAQEVEQIPELSWMVVPLKVIKIDDSTGEEFIMGGKQLESGEKLKGIKNQNIVTYLVKAFQESHAKVTTLEQQNAILTDNLNTILKAQGLSPINSQQSLLTKHQTQISQQQTQISQQQTQIIKQQIQISDQQSQIIQLHNIVNKLEDTIKKGTVSSKRTSYS